MPTTAFTTPNGERFVLLPEDEHKRLVAAAQKAKPSPVAVPSHVANRIFAGEHPVRVYREWRGMTAKELAARAGLSPGHLSDVETGRRQASASARGALAAALDLEADDLPPAQME